MMTEYNHAYRVDRLREQIAHLKVLLAATDEQLQNDHHNIALWHKSVLIHEAENASFWFRINDYEDEIRSLTARPKAKVKAKK